MQLKRLNLRKNNWSSESFKFDEVLSESASQKRVYEVVAKPVVEVGSKLKKSVFTLMACFHVTSSTRSKRFYAFSPFVLIYHHYIISMNTQFFWILKRYGMYLQRWDCWTVWSLIICKIFLRYIWYPMRALGCLNVSTTKSTFGDPFCLEWKA